MSWIDLAIGAGITAAAYSSGHGIGFTRGRLTERNKLTVGPKLVCSCEHGFGSHEAGGKCHAEVQRANKWEKDYGDPRGWEYVTCPCRTYDGPAPLPDVLNWQPPKEV
jgi:hypothetical protein